MKIFVKAKTRAKKQKVEKVSDDTFIVYVTAPPEKGRANSEIIEALARYFGIAKSNIKIVSGHTSQTKLIQIS